MCPVGIVEESWPRQTCDAHYWNGIPGTSTSTSSTSTSDQSPLDDPSTPTSSTTIDEGTSPLDSDDYESPLDSDGGVSDGSPRSFEIDPPSSPGTLPINSGVMMLPSLYMLILGLAWRSTGLHLSCLFLHYFHFFAWPCAAPLVGYSLPRLYAACFTIPCVQGC